MPESILYARGPPDRLRILLLALSLDKHTQGIGQGGQANQKLRTNEGRSSLPLGTCSVPEEVVRASCRSRKLTDAIRNT